jgi:hypothetical protein
MQEKVMPVGQQGFDHTAVIFESPYKFAIQLPLFPNKGLRQNLYKKNNNY